MLENDDCAGPANGLCGNVPIQNGPGYATLLTPGNTASQTAAPSSVSLSTGAGVPTLSYTTPKSAATDEYGGGISIQNVGQASQPSEINTEALATATPSTVITSSSTPQAPAPTEMIAPDPQKGSIVSTSTYTSAGVVYDVAIEEVVVYVTVDDSAPKPKQRRHAHHMHHRRDREHGLLGRR